MSEHHALERGDLRVELINLGEGYDGDYTGRSNDRELMRFYVQRHTGEGGFEDLDDGSYCTAILVSDHDHHERFLVEIMDAADKWQFSGERRVIEKASWIGSA